MHHPLVHPLTLRCHFFEFYYTTDFLLRAARHLQPRALIIIDSVDLHYLREAEAFRIGLNQHRAEQNTQQVELSCYRKADVVIAVSETERNILVSEGIASVSIISNIVPIIKRVQRVREAELLFIGGFEHEPNEIAVLWFYKNVWPKVKARIPKARWTIAGYATPPAVRALAGNGVEVVGYVEHTATLLDRAQLSIAPLTYGGGMKGKVSEALAAGVPLVTTRFGAQGLEDGAGHAFVVADTAEAFGDSVVTLLQDSIARESFSRNGTLLAKRMCSNDSAAEAIAQLVERTENGFATIKLHVRPFAFASLTAQYAIMRWRQRPNSQTRRD